MRLTTPVPDLNELESLGSGQEHHKDQSSTRRFGIRWKSRRFRVTKTLPCSRTIAAIRRSILRTLSFSFFSASYRLIDASVIGRIRHRPRSGIDSAKALVHSCLFFGEADLSEQPIPPRDFFFHRNHGNCYLGKRAERRVWRSRADALGCRARAYPCRQHEGSWDFRIVFDLLAIRLDLRSPTIEEGLVSINARAG